MCPSDLPPLKFRWQNHRREVSSVFRLTVISMSREERHYFCFVCKFIVTALRLSQAVMTLATSVPSSGLSPVALKNEEVLGTEDVVTAFVCFEHAGADRCGPV
jgi:hypothetical protein